MILVEVGLSDLMLHHLINEREYFSGYEVGEILHDGLKVMLNMVPRYFMQMISRGQDIYDMSEITCKEYEYFLPLQILDGETILSRTI